MLIDVILPQLGESVVEGTISKWLVREGDLVKKEQPIVSIATDKADSELPSPSAGRVAKILATEGQVVAVKTVIAQIDEGASASLSISPGAPVSMPPPPSLPSPVPPAFRKRLRRRRAEARRRRPRDADRPQGGTRARRRPRERPRDG